jgi:FAD/FMN-containing dehydrogenase
MVDLVRALKRTGFSGPVVGPASPDYDSLRQICNAAVDMHPAVIARCLGRADIQRAVVFAREKNLELATRGGGHQVTGYGLRPTRSLLIDTRLMTGVRLLGSGRNRYARVAAGARWCDVDRLTVPRGFAAVGGENRFVGVAGYALGGGYGYLSRSRGLCCDSIRAIEMINAAGQRMLLSAQRHPELFWAMCGAGTGNFGVVSRLDLAVRPIRKQVFTCSMFWDLSCAAAVFDAYQQLQLAAPRELCLNLELGLWMGRRHVSVTGMFDGEGKEGERLIASLLRLKPEQRRIKVESYLAFQSMGGNSAGLSSVWKTGYPNCKLFPDRAVNLIVEKLRELPSFAQGTLAGLEPLGGRINDLPADANAFVHRDKLWNFDIFAFWQKPEEGAALTSWATQFYADMQPYLSGFVYQNYPDTGLKDWRHAYYGANYPRLQEIKRKHDPDRVFGHMQGVD